MAAWWTMSCVCGATLKGAGGTALGGTTTDLMSTKQNVVGTSTPPTTIEATVDARNKASERTPSPCGGMGVARDYGGHALTLSVCSQPKRYPAGTTHREGEWRRPDCRKGRADGGHPYEMAHRRSLTEGPPRGLQRGNPLHAMMNTWWDFVGVALARRLWLSRR